MNVVTYVSTKRITKMPHFYPISFKDIQIKTISPPISGHIVIISTHKLLNVTKADKGTAFNIHFPILRHARSTR